MVGDAFQRSQTTVLAPETMPPTDAANSCRVDTDYRLLHGTRKLALRHPQNAHRTPWPPESPPGLLTILRNGVVQVRQHLPRQVLPVVYFPIVADELLLCHLSFHLTEEKSHQQRNQAALSF
jgi:hypothetical protein